MGPLGAIAVNERVVLDGKYLTSARLAGSVPHMMETVQYLVERAVSERKK